jgi:iron complex transport system ATP-binding protein
VLLLDEPTSFLDYRHQVQILDMLDRLHRERGLTVVAVTHDLNSMVAFSDTVLALVNGRTAFFGTPSEVLSEENLGSIYGAGFRLVPGGYDGLPLVVPARNGS